jgi:tetratricopeptide (TPR) repeat protein
MLAIVEKDDAALYWNLAALALCERSQEERAQRWKGSLLNNIGWTYHAMGRYDEALDIFTRGLVWQSAANRSKETRIAQWTIGRTLRSMGRYAEALAIQEELRRADPSDGYVDEEMAECLLALGRDAEARPNFAAAHAQLSSDPWLAEKEPERIARLASLGGKIDTDVNEAVPQ